MTQPMYYSRFSARAASRGGNLPHWAQRCATFVTFRLDDSLPQQKLDQYEAERTAWLREHPQPWDDKTESDYLALFPQRFEKWLDAGHGSCILRDGRARAAVEAALRHFDGIRYSLYAFVVMDNHVHVLFMPEVEFDGRAIVTGWKRFSARAVNAALGRSGTLWQKESYDHLVRNVEEFNAILSYIRQNAPERAYDAYAVDAKPVRVPVDAKSVRVPVDAKSVRVPVDAKSVRVEIGIDTSLSDAEGIPRLRESDAEGIPRLREERVSRSEALLGEAAMARLAELRVLIVGVGGVGSWCAEALVRTGVRHLVLMDDDIVQPSNLNRQCPATARTIGQLKVEAMRTRLLEIAPEAEIVAHAERFPGDATASSRLPDTVDVVVDAIDSVDSKAALILSATRRGIPIVSSMGAARRLDPTCVKVVRFDKVEGDGLARALRNRFRRLGEFPGRFDCVVSTEPPVAAEKGSIMPVTAAFGMALAAWILENFKSSVNAAPQGGDL